MGWQRVLPRAWRLTVRLEVGGGAAPAHYALVLDQVRSLRAEREIPLPWRYAELTEIHVSTAGEGFTVDLVLWEDGTGLTVICENLAVGPDAEAD